MALDKSLNTLSVAPPEIVAFTNSCRLKCTERKDRRCFCSEIRLNDDSLLPPVPAVFEVEAGVVSGNGRESNPDCVRTRARFAITTTISQIDESK